MEIAEGAGVGAGEGGFGRAAGCRWCGGRGRGGQNEEGERAVSGNQPHSYRGGGGGGGFRAGGR